ncbi:hypothetical protein [Lapidilactobacillus wuchangensis]|uniref:hypothetical protein n=1 Tax=Lapidilactobacillus wuchangensis TaxID=2486001 RepID=UPI000F79208F|nr:hypothetical protein [Lapidilactobacillus wuchangensis]
MWKRKLVSFILLVSFLGIVFNSATTVKADVNTSNYDITIVSGENSGSGQTSTTNKNQGVTLPKTNIVNQVKGRLPQLSDQQTLNLIIGGLLLILVLLGVLIRQLNKRREV